MSASPSTIFAGPEHVGKICPVCGASIVPYQMIEIAGPEGVPLHRRCYEASQRGEAPAMAAAAEAPAPGAASFAGAPLRGEATTETMRVRGSKIFILLLCLFFVIIGPMVGIVVGFLWADPQASPLRRRDGRELLIFASIVFTLQLIGLVLGMTGVMEALQSATLGHSGILPTIP
jgi:hypothetical protein